MSGNPESLAFNDWHNLRQRNSDATLEDIRICHLELLFPSIISQAIIKDAYRDEDLERFDQAIDDLRIDLAAALPLALGDDRPAPSDVISFMVDVFQVQESTARAAYSTSIYYNPNML